MPCGAITNAYLMHTRAASCILPVGRHSILSDCPPHFLLPAQAATFRPLKAFLIELALGWVAHKAEMQLDPKFKLPKMKYKGDQVSSTSSSIHPSGDQQPPFRMPSLATCRLHLAVDLLWNMTHSGGDPEHPGGEEAPGVRGHGR